VWWRLQIADLGSARSAASEGYHWAEQPEPGGGGHGRGSVRFRDLPGVEGLRCSCAGTMQCARSVDRRCARCRQQRHTRCTLTPISFTIHWYPVPSHHALQVRALSAAAPHPAHMPHLDAEDGGPVRLHDLYVRLGENPGFEAPLAQLFSVEMVRHCWSCRSRLQVYAGDCRLPLCSLSLL
jgi:hypothetical protein